MTEPLLLVGVNASAAPEKIPAHLIADVLDFCYRSRRKKPARLDILVADDAEMAKLNRRHLGKNRPTDVLAFADGEPEDGVLRLGDVAIGLDVAEREAAARGIAVEYELVFYALHGLLHLLGMDDGTDRERGLMHRAQAKAMRDFGLPAGDRYLDLWDAGGEEEDGG
jgi:rRNA maturation RNase YbeY